MIGGNHYILVRDISNVNTGTISNNKPNSTDGPESGDKPTQAEIDYLLANNDKLGYTVYFSDNELTKIKKYLWQDIQNYRIEKGLPAYKTNTELEDFVGNVTSTETNLWKYESNLNAVTADQLAMYLPSLSKNGMDISDSFDIPNYYGHGEVGSSQPSSFNFKDRDPEHVATQIFNSFKESKDYNSMILGDNDQLAFAAIGLHYNWHGTSPKTSVGVVFIEVSGSSSKWESFYNVN
ncbi:hypothetical protein [Lactobacillus sp. ESL0677]|uniref:hypothetical protein n=1 Tax=Lactobacillus sp. ESL0677 TaxID=2983208 RepID=UPI0023F6BB91|nr:hypothetical protein [Lactobacillus sp. ESL0677]WEV36576.1 hypothetical protein OZX76_07515 [Lactobacillus sp. ESL0677]